VEGLLLLRRKSKTMLMVAALSRHTTSRPHIPPKRSIWRVRYSSHRPLMQVAAEFGQVECVKELLAKAEEQLSADDQRQHVNAQSVGNSSTAVHYAIFGTTCSRGGTDTASPNEQQKQCVDALFKRRADLSIKNKDGEDAAACATKKGFASWANRLRMLRESVDRATV
jgi:hypothetical protein